jgi:response regulator RpfG family c-di-GMP phosphodiesterase
MALIRLSAEIKGRSKKASPESFDFFAGALRSLSRLKGAAHADVRMTCLFDSAVFLCENGFRAEALEAAHQLEQLAGQAGAKPWIRKSATLSGMIHADLGNIADSVINSSKAIDLAREGGDITGEVASLINLGAALNYGGLFREAIPCLQSASRLARSSNLTVALKGAELLPAELEAAALTNLAQSYLHLEEFGQGFRVISKALQRCPVPATAINASSRAIREFTFVQLSLALGNLNAARRHSDLCENFGLMAGTIRSRLVANISKGLCEIHGGDIGNGLAILEAQLVAAGEIESFRTEALIALVHAYDHGGKADRALECMQQLLSHIRKARQETVVALLSLTSIDAAMFSPESADLRGLTSRESDLRAKVAELEAANSRFEMFERFAVAADLKEEASGQHGYRVGKLASLIAGDLEWPSDSRHLIEISARLHDVGKIAIPDHILLSSEQLKNAERHFMSSHTSIGAELLSRGNAAQLGMAEEIARHHHEWWDGSGYPSKLSGKRIPIHARIVALADVFDALTHGRPFAEPWPIDRALEEIRNRRGTQFDPDLTDIFLRLIERLRSEHADLDAFLGQAGRDSPFLLAREKIRRMLAEGRENQRKTTVATSATRH